VTDDGKGRRTARMLVLQHLAERLVCVRELRQM
jgi:hypothetical protein